MTESAGMALPVPTGDDDDDIQILYENDDDITASFFSFFTLFLSSLGELCLPSIEHQFESLQLRIDFLLC